MRKLCVTILLLVCIASVCAQEQTSAPANVDLKQLFSGNVHPLSMKLGDLDSDWRVVNAVQDTSGMNAYMALLMREAMSGVMGADRYFTKGDTITIGTETYLVTYSPKIGATPMDIFKSSGPPEPKPLTAESTLALALLNLRTAGSLTNITPFDLNEQITPTTPEETEQVVEDLTTEAKGRKSLDNLKQLGMALQMYAADWDDTLPPMGSMDQVREPLKPYIRHIGEEGADVFTNPFTGQPYGLNTILSEHKLKQIQYPSQMVVFYEDITWRDGSRAAAFLDGHVGLIPSSDWERVKRLSKIP